MAMSLIKACKQLEIGIATAVEYLQKQGIEVVENPNIKLSDEDYLTLVRGYNKTLADEIEAQKNKKVVVEEPKKAPATPQKEEVITPTNDIHVKVVGRMDIEEKKAAANETEKEAMVESPKNDQVDAGQVAPVEGKMKAEKKPKQDTPKETEVQEQPKSEAKETHGKKKKRFEFSETEDGVVEVKVHNSELEKRPNVIGKLNLDEMNMSTHPAKKTKEEKKKEKEERLQNKKNQSQKDNVDNAGSQDQNATEKTSRTRIKGKKSKIDVDNFDFKANKNNHNGKRSHRGYKNEISEEEVQRQVKETMSSFQTPKGKTNYSKYKRERRELEREKVALEKEIRAEQSKTLKLTEFVTVNDLAVMMNVPVVKVISTCMSIGIMVSINQRLEADTINLVAEEFGFTTEFVSAKVVEEIQQTEENYNEEDVERRAPIITVMGHVDHGKTSLLDHIRNTNVIAGEAGGITQHIGAYNVKLKNGQHLTFLDTPGHEAFTAMRARGAKVTDIAIIIIAADDAVMPQTVEAINHAQLAGVPMIFAINKCDKPGANPDKIKEQLANMNILVEDWGGKYQCQNISAKSGDGVFELLEKVLLEAEMLDLKANPKRRAKGSIIESSLDKGRGYVATVLVSDGTLHVGDVILAGIYHGRVKAMFNERGQKVEQVLPGEPCLFLGLNGAPQAGDDFIVLPNEQEARLLANKREQLQREQSVRTKKHLGLDEIGRRLAIGDFKELNIIVKGDVDGSVEALSDSLIKLSTENIQVNVIHKAVGAISESDILLAEASNAIVVGFQVRPTSTARKMADKEEIDIRLYSIIYDALEEIKSAMAGMLSPDIKEEKTATAEVLQTFRISKVGTIAGCIVREGKIKRANKCHLIRDGIVIYTGELDSLKHGKDDIKEAGVNTECGLSIKGYNDVQVGDMIETFEQVEVAKEL